MSKDSRVLGQEAGQMSSGEIAGGSNGPPPPGGVALPGLSGTSDGPGVPHTEGGEVAGATGPSAAYNEPPPLYSEANYPGQAGYPGGYNPPPVVYPQHGEYPAAQGAYPAAAYQQGGSGHEQGVNTQSTAYDSTQSCPPPKGYEEQKGPAVIDAQPTQTNVIVVSPQAGYPPLSGEWQNGICGCFSNANICILSWCCSCYVLGKNAEHFGESFGLYCCCSIIGLFRFVLHTILRGKIREKRGIAGSMLGDCCYVYWLSCCALTQETNELRSMKDDTEPILIIDRQ